MDVCGRTQAKIYYELRVARQITACAANAQQEDHGLRRNNACICIDVCIFDFSRAPSPTPTR
jgi:hypothetical protein